MGKEEYNIFDEFKSEKENKANSIPECQKNIMLICNPTAPKGNQ